MTESGRVTAGARFVDDPAGNHGPRRDGRPATTVRRTRDVSLRKTLDEKLARFEELEKQLADPEVLAIPARVAAAAREHGSLARLAKKYRRFKGINRQIAEAQEMIEGKDAEMREMAEAELPTLRKEREGLWDELLGMTIGGEDAQRTRVVMEIRAGTGGDEAALFARDLYEMYKHHAESKRWKVEVLDLNATELGGFKEIILGIEGDGVFRELQYESGGHRVQRVPETETKGRIHTSAATVAVLPEPEDVEIELKPDDFRKDIFCASGPGGQHVNKTASAIRLTHLETGIVVQCQDEKSQHKNFAKALRVLKTRLYEAKRKEEHEKRASERKTLVGSGDRSQRIRTYNFSENRVTDHRINLTLYKLDAILAGAVQPLTDALTDFDRQQLREEMASVD
jgi:peptide chain release factor 1